MIDNIIYDAVNTMLLTQWHNILTVIYNDENQQTIMTTTWQFIKETKRQLILLPKLQIKLMIKQITRMMTNCRENHNYHARWQTHTSSTPNKQQYSCLSTVTQHTSTGFVMSSCMTCLSPLPQTTSNSVTSLTGWKPLVGSQVLPGMRR